MKLFSVLFLLCSFKFCISYKILAVLHTPSFSHFIAGGAIAKELALKGHEVTVLSTYPQKKPIKNYRDIELTGMREWIIDFMSKVNLIDYENENIITKTNFPNEMGYIMSKIVYEHDAVKKLMKSHEIFDVVIIEQFVSEALYGLCYHFKAPCISFSSVGSTIWTNRLVGNIGLASYVPDVSGYYSPSMTFLERLHNLITLIYQELNYHLYTLPKLDQLLHEHIPDAPPLSQLVYNISLVLLNSQTALTGAVPLTPNIVEIGGIHLQSFKKSKDEKLPQDVQNFLDKHDQVIYFAFGSNFNSKSIPEEKLEAIFDALRKYGKPVLWKFDDDELPAGLEHVKIGKWFPQTAVLAHKNVKAFITHCGRLSTLESLYYGVPMIGISLFAEQAHNAAEMAHLGYAVWVKFNELTKGKLYKALVEITENPKYYNEAQLRSKIMQKENQIEKAINWIEHVVEYKGAVYLRNAGVDLPWYQFWMVDVISFVIILIIFVNTLIAYLILKMFSKKSSNKKQKLN
ncbi:UDP-glucosyltransferase 2-like [Onthophagus taurus]|uniref:UDP-glucosyltransferase 2-like n=1 Tax=Onthophagus taurus TaxID=166361 RepID=UPI0039BE5A98